MLEMAPNRLGQTGFWTYVLQHNCCCLQLPFYDTTHLQVLTTTQHICKCSLCLSFLDLPIHNLRHSFLATLRRSCPAGFACTVSIPSLGPPAPRTASSRQADPLCSQLLCSAWPAAALLAQPRTTHTRTLSTCQQLTRASTWRTTSRVDHRLSAC